MEKALPPAGHPGHLAFNMIVFAGLVLLAAALWRVASGYVILLFIPALLLCFYQIVVTQAYGLRLDDRHWRICAREGVVEIPADRISCLRVTRHGAVARATLILTDGSKVAIPFDLAPMPVALMQAASAHGIPVQTG